MAIYRGSGIVGFKTMLYIETGCRECKVQTLQLERVVSDHLPPNVKCLQCTRCGLLDITLVDITTARQVRN
jgi:hypothetical protein